MGAQQGKEASTKNQPNSNQLSSNTNRDLIHCNPRIATIGHSKHSQRSRSKDGLNSNKLLIDPNGECIELFKAVDVKLMIQSLHICILHTYSCEDSSLYLVGKVSVYDLHSLQFDQDVTWKPHLSIIIAFVHKKC